jgi:biopolymer transport protein ExbB
MMGFDFELGALHVARPVANNFYGDFLKVFFMRLQSFGARLVFVLALCSAVAAPTLVLAQQAAPVASAVAAVNAASAPSSTDAAAVAAIKAPAPAAAEENPYGLKALWSQGDWVNKGTLIILLIMSMGSWYILVTKYMEQRKQAQQAKAAQAQFWAADTVAQGAELLSAESPYRFVVDASLEAIKKHDGLRGAVDFGTWTGQSIERAVGHVQSRMQEGLAFLATVGSTGPFVGLFGTVWGIYNALVKIGASGQASIDKVAGPVGEALIMTAIGLAVAVPAVLGYNYLVRRNKAAIEQLRDFGSDLHSVLLSQGKQ